MTVFFNQPRRYSMPETVTHGAAVYIVRDVLTSDRRFAGYCQYKTKRADGSTVWKPCPEGVDFKKIEPFEAPRNG